MTLSLTNKRVLITGAGSNLGRELAFELADRGAALILLDDDPEALDHTALVCGELGARVITHVVNVSSTEHMTQIAARIHERMPAVDVVINHARVGETGSFLRTDADTWRWAIDSAVMGVVHGCQLFVPKMVEHAAHGHVLNIVSATGDCAGKLTPIYAATKSAVVGLSNSLRAELKPHDICVTSLCPGVLNEEAKLSRATQAIIHALETRHNSALSVTPEPWLLYYGSRLAPRTLSKVISRNWL